MSTPTRRRYPALYEYFCLYAGLIALGLPCLLWSSLAGLLHPFLPERLGRRLGRRVMSAVFNLNLRWLSLLGACRFDISALDELRDQGPMILAPNHPCMLDAVMVISRLTNVACIMKAELMNNLFLGGGSRLARFIPNSRPLQMVHAACNELAKGSQLLIFPEGTRTVRYPVNAMIPSVALIARRARVPVQVILIETDSAYLSKGWPLFRRPPMPVRYRIRLGPRFDPPTATAAFGAQLESCFAAQLARAELVPPQFSDAAGLPSLGAQDRLRP